MKQIKLNNPPNPEQSGYKTNPLAHARALYDWALRTKSSIETASAQNDTPLQQSFMVSSFATTTVLTGTSSGTDIANFVCTLVQAMIDKGIITTTTSTGG